MKAFFLGATSIIVLLVFVATCAGIRSDRLERSERLERAAGSEIRQTQAKSYDGVYVAGAVRKPHGQGPFPAILYIHGGIGGRGTENAVKMLKGRVAQHFYELGYVGYATDYRRYHFGEDEIRDVLAAYRKLRSLPFVDKNRVAVIGGSHGGYLAAMLATRTDPAATVSFAGLTDVEGMFYQAGLELSAQFEGWRDWHRELMTHGNRGRSQSELPDSPRWVPGGNLLLQPGSAGYEVALELGGRYGDRLDYIRNVSPKEQAARVNGPILYLVGGADSLRIAGEKWIKKLNKRGVVAEYSEHEDMGHGFYWGDRPNPSPQFYDALKVTSDFIEKHLN